MDCMIDKNNDRCTCTYEPCPRKGRCCECVAFHKRNGELPGCLFPPEAEKIYNRSARYFVESYKEGL